MFRDVSITRILALATFATLLASRPVAASGGRIVSLAPSITETLFALGAGPEVVGVSEYCDYPAATKSLPKVGTFLTPNVEMIAGLRPTLVIGLRTSSNLREIRAIKAMGCATLMVSDDSIDEIQQTILRIGDRINRAGEAQELVRNISSRIDSVRARLARVAPRKVLMVVGHQPLVAVGQDTYLDELLKIAGGINIADSAGQQWPQLSIEYVIDAAPDVIVDGRMGTDPASPNGYWSRYRLIPAVRSHNVYGYPQDLMLHPGPRVWQALDLLARLIHPEVFGPASNATVAEQERSR